MSPRLVAVMTAWPKLAEIRGFEAQLRSIPRAGLELDDVMQEAYIVALACAGRFNEKRGGDVAAYFFKSLKMRIKPQMSGFGTGGDDETSCGDFHAAASFDQWLDDDKGIEQWRQFEGSEEVEKALASRADITRRQTRNRLKKLIKLAEKGIPAGALVAGFVAPKSARGRPSAAERAAAADMQMCLKGF